MGIIKSGVGAGIGTWLTGGGVLTFILLFILFQYAC